jgi:hypothetical protein
VGTVSKGETVTDLSIIACRCEDVTIGEIRHAISRGGRTFDDVKRMTRSGMGECQGRMCECVVIELLCREAGISPAGVAPRSVRPPVRPVTVEFLGASETETPEHESSEHWFRGDLGTSADPPGAG